MTESNSFYQCGYFRVDFGFNKMLNLFFERLATSTLAETREAVKNRRIKKKKRKRKRLIDRCKRGENNLLEIFVNL